MMLNVVQDRKSTRLNSSHTVIYTLSLHDALPISPHHGAVISHPGPQSASGIGHLSTRLVRADDAERGALLTHYHHDRLLPVSGDQRYAQRRQRHLYHHRPGIHWSQQRPHASRVHARRSRHFKRFSWLLSLLSRTRGLGALSRDRHCPQNLLHAADLTHAAGCGGTAAGDHHAGLRSARKV